MSQKQNNGEPALARKAFLKAGALAGVASVAACAAALPGCAGGSGTSAANSNSSETSASAAPESKLLGVCAYSGTRVNPVGNSSALFLSANRHVLEGLYDLDMHTYETYPALAADAPRKVSDLEYEITLRSGAEYSDGTPVTAGDVVNAIALNQSDETYGPFLSFIAEAQAKGDTTVVLRLNHPFDGLVEKRLSLVKVFPASLSEDVVSRMPVGSGPWVYESIDGSDGGEVRFTPNARYQGPFAAEADHMVWQVRLENASRARMLAEGEASVAEDVALNEVGRIVDAGASVDYEHSFGQVLLMFNCLKKPFNDVRVRQAFFYAINVEKLINSQLDGHAQALTGFLPKSHPNYHRASTVYTYDPEKARQLLAQAGVTNLDFTLTVNSTRVRDFAAQIQNDLHAIGIAMRIDQTRVDWTELAPPEPGDVLPFDVILTPGDPSCFGNDPDLLMSWWYGDNVWTQGRSCWAKAADGAFEQLQELLLQARMAPVEGRQAIWNECFDLIAENVPLYGLFHRDMVTGYRPGELSGFAPISTTGLDLLGVAPADAS